MKKFYSVLILCLLFCRSVSAEYFYNTNGANVNIIKQTGKIGEMTGVTVTDGSEIIYVTQALSNAEGKINITIDFEGKSYGEYTLITNTAGKITEDTIYYSEEPASGEAQKPVEGLKSSDVKVFELYPTRYGAELIAENTASESKSLTVYKALYKNNILTDVKLSEATVPALSGKIKYPVSFADNADTEYKISYFVWDSMMKPYSRSLKDSRLAWIDFDDNTSKNIRAFLPSGCNFENVTNNERNGVLLNTVSSDLKIGTKYTISSNKPLTWVKISLTSSGYNSVQFVNESGFYKYSFTMQRHSNISENETQYLFLRSTVSERTFVNNISQLDGFDIQIEEGTTATGYEPYHESISTNIYLDEPLRKVGDYADYIDFENGKVIRQVLEESFDGSESWYLWETALNNHVKYALGNVTPILNGGGNIKVLSNMFMHSTTYEKDTMNAYRFPDIRGWIAATVDVETFPNVEDFKNFLSTQSNVNKPLKVYFAMPKKETPLTLPIIPTFKGTSIISVDTTIQPSNAEIEYYSNAKER